MRGSKSNKFSIISVCIFFVFIGIAVWIENGEMQEYKADALEERLLYSSQSEFLYTLFPVFGYMEDKMWEQDVSLDRKLLEEEIPLFSCISDMQYLRNIYEDEETFRQLAELTGEERKLLLENTEGVLNTPEFYDEMISENRHAVMFVRESDFFTGGCGFISELSTAWVTEFVKASEKTVEYDNGKLLDYEFVMENFYTVDACTSAGADVINPAALSEYDVTIDKTAPGPHILIYHTHSQEAFIDSIPGDKSTTIVGAGAKLASLLRDEYGYEVYHHIGEYDVGSRDDAYARSGPALEKILETYPQIQVVIDLHRDGVDESRHLVTTWEGRQVAQFMFFNGLSYVNTKGQIDYLPNENLMGNLALSYKAVIAANEYYPGLARRNYLNGYRYNMHYRDKSFLIELGAQTNTVDEIMSACEPLAHVIDMVLSGEENTD